MTKQKTVEVAGRTYRVGADVDLDREEVRDSTGRRVTSADVDRLVAEGRAALPGRGRPSLSGPGKTSPAVSVRLPEALKAAVDARAQAEGRAPAELIRDAIERYMAPR